MPVSDQFFRLLALHQRLDARLQQLRTLRWLDPFEVARLKKLKLAVKDQLARRSRPQQIARNDTR